MAGHFNSAGVDRYDLRAFSLEHPFHHFWAGAKGNKKNIAAVIERQESAGYKVNVPYKYLVPCLYAGYKGGFKVIFYVRVHPDWK